MTVRYLPKSAFYAMSIAVVALAAACSPADNGPSSDQTDPNDPSALDEKTRAILAPGEVKRENGATGGIKPQVALLMPFQGNICESTTNNECMNNLVRTESDGCLCYDPSDTCT